MKWTVYTVSSTVEAEDYICAALADMGFDGVEIIDSVPLSKQEEAAQFIDIPPVLDETDRSSKIRCYEECSEDVSESDFAKRAAEILDAVSVYRDIVNMGELSVETSVTEDLDWINNWKQYFHSFRIGDDILIKPTWESDATEKEGDLVVEIDPGTAFGTGSHETTWLCIETLREHVNEGDSVLDIGCGSGILSIIAKKLGAGCCIGVDIDPIAVDVSKENAKQNKLTVADNAKPAILPGTVSFYACDVITDKAAKDALILDRYPVVVANILADVIKLLLPIVRDFVAPGGCFIASGILKEREEEMRKAFSENGYKITGCRYRNDWVCMCAEPV